MELSVYGVDINQKVVNTINKGEIHIVEPELDGIVQKAVDTIIPSNIRNNTLCIGRDSELTNLELIKQL